MGVNEKEVSLPESKPWETFHIIEMADELHEQD